MEGEASVETVVEVNVVAKDGLALVDESLLIDWNANVDRTRNKSAPKTVTMNCRIVAA